MDHDYIDIFPWNINFNTGVEEIDQQHQTLVALLNKVASCITLQRSNIELDSLINELSEEEWLEQDMIVGIISFSSRQTELFNLFAKETP